MSMRHERARAGLDVKGIRERARRGLEKGAVTEDYRADRRKALELLNAALATEIICVLRYKRHQYMAKGIHAEGVAAEFAEHAVQEQAHADSIAERIVQLGGEPDYSPVGLAARSHSEYVEGKDLVDMMKEDLVAERVAIESYREMVRWFGDEDPTSRKLLEEILAQEEEHAEDLSSLLTGMRQEATG